MGKEHFGYDAAGNMLFNREYDFTYGAANRLLSYACDNVRFVYDDDGNIVTKTTPEGVTQYRWDSESQLIGITKPDGTVIAYQYDELGRRVQKARTGSTSDASWRWSYLGEDICRETSPLGTSTYVHGPGVDEPLSVSWQSLYGHGQTTSGYYVPDGLGSLTRIVDGSGTVLNQYRYTAFGKMKQVQESFPNFYTYTGREWDADAGLYYYRARWYDPAIGRFMSEDPIGFAGGDANLFRYVLNGPINGVDPSGLAEIKWPLLLIGIQHVLEGGGIMGVGIFAPIGLAEFGPVGVAVGLGGTVVLVPIGATIAEMGWQDIREALHEDSSSKRDSSSSTNCPSGADSSSSSDGSSANK